MTNPIISAESWYFTFSIFENFKLIVKTFVCSVLNGNKYTPSPPEVLEDI